MNNIDKLLGTYTGLMTIILTIGALMTLTNSSPILLIVIFPLTGYMILQGVKALYSLKYGKRRKHSNHQSSHLSSLKQKQATRTSLTSHASLARIFTQNGAGFVVTIALLVIAITSLAVKHHLESQSFVSPISQQKMITFNVR